MAEPLVWSGNGGAVWGKSGGHISGKSCALGNCILYGKGTETFCLLQPLGTEERGRL